MVVVTLVGEGLTLAPLLRALGLAEGDEQRRREAMARARVTEAGLARLDELAEAGEVDEDTANVYRQLFELRLERVRALLDDADGDGHRAAHAAALPRRARPARSAPSWTTCTGAARSATRSAAPSPSPLTCKNAADSGGTARHPRDGTTIGR